MPAIDNEIMSLGLSADRLVDCRIQDAVTFRGAKRASQIGGRIVIDVIDDGAGLNRAKILSKAAERGISVSDSMTDEDVWQLIFAPGFSTADAVTDISGRGVGMDVVLRNVQSMGGRVNISSEPGKGTRVTISLPLTLAILESFQSSRPPQTTNELRWDPKEILQIASKPPALSPTHEAH